MFMLESLRKVNVGNALEGDSYLSLWRLRKRCMLKGGGIFLLIVIKGCYINKVIMLIESFPSEWGGLIFIA